MKNLLILLAFLLPSTFAFSPVGYNDTTCPTPTNVAVTGKTFASISFSWDAMSGAVEYELEYLKQGETVPVGVTVSSTSHTFSGLTAGTYTFYFRTDCGGSMSNPFIVIDNV